MKFDLSYTMFELADNGFRFNETIGFLKSINKSSRFEMFQTPIFLSPLEGELLGCIRFAKSANFNIISLVGYIGLKPSKGNRNCYKGISLCVKINSSIPNIVILSNQFENIFNSFRSTSVLPSSLQTSMKFKENLRIDNLLNRKKNVYEILNSSVNWASMLVYILDSLNGENKLSKRIFFSNSPLIKSKNIDENEIVIRNRSENIEKIQSEFISQLEDRYHLANDRFSEIENQHLSKVENLKLSIIELNKEISVAKNSLEKIEKRKKELSVLNKQIEERVDNLKLRREKINKQIFYKIKLYRFIKKYYWLILLIMMTIVIIGILAITLDKK